MSAFTVFIYSRSTNDGTVCFIFLLVFLLFSLVQEQLQRTPPSTGSEWFTACRV